MFETTLDHRVKIRVCSLCSPRIESFFLYICPVRTLKGLAEMRVLGLGLGLVLLILIAHSIIYISIQKKLA